MINTYYMMRQNVLLAKFIFSSALSRPGTCLSTCRYSSSAPSSWYSIGMWTNTLAAFGHWRRQASRPSQPPLMFWSKLPRRSGQPLPRCELMLWFVFVFSDYDLVWVKCSIFWLLPNHSCSAKLSGPWRIQTLCSTTIWALLSEASPTWWLYL